MANFCKKCGNALNIEYGLCPVCDKVKIEEKEALKVQESQEVIAPEPQAVVGFCMDCGSPLDPVTGTCNRCNPATSENNDFADDYNQVDNSKAPHKNKESKPKKKRKELSNGLSLTLVIIMSFFVLLTSLIPIVALAARTTTTQDNVEDILDELDLIAVMEEIPLNEEFGVDGVDNFYEGLCYVLEEEYDANVTDNRMEEFIEESDILEDMAAKVIEYTDDIFKGTEEFTLTVDDVADILKNNRKAMSNAFDTEFTKSDCEDIAQWILPEEETDFYPEVLRDEMPLVMGLAQYGCSYITIIIMFAVAIILITLMVLICRLTHALMGTGIALTVSGLITTVVTIIASAFGSLWKTICAGEELIAVISSEAIKMNTALFVIPLVVGVLVMTGGIVLIVMKKKKKAKEADKSNKANS